MRWPAAEDGRTIVPVFASTEEVPGVSVVTAAAAIAFGAVGAGSGASVSPVRAGATVAVAGGADDLGDAVNAGAETLLAVSSLLARSRGERRCTRLAAITIAMADAKTTRSTCQPTRRRAARSGRSDGGGGRVGGGNDITGGGRID